MDTSDNTIAQHDAGLLFTFFKNELDPANFNHCMVVQSFIKSFSYWNVPVEDKIKKIFQSDTYLLYDLLTNRMQKKELEMSSEEFRKYQKEKIAELTLDNTEQDYQNLFHQLSEIKNNLSQRSSWSFDQGINTIFDELADRTPDLFFNVVKQYLEQRDYLNINPWVVVSRLITTNGASKAYDLISKVDFLAKDRWLFRYYETLSKEDIKEDDTEKLLSLYNAADAQNIPRDFDYILKYESLNKGLIEQVVRIIVDRSTADEMIAHTLYNLFNSHADISKGLLGLFSDASLLEDAYLALDKTDSHCDYDGKSFSLLLDNRQDFIIKYLKDFFARKKYISYHDCSRDFSFIWQHNYTFLVMKIIASHVYHYYKEHRCHNCFKMFFNRNVNEQTDEQIIAKQDEFLLDEINANPSNIDYLKFIFILISGFKNERKLKFYSAFLLCNSSFDDFKKIPFESSLRSGEGQRGSFVPSFQRDISFMEKLIDACNTVELLQQRQYLEERIRQWRERIKFEKKRDFTEEY